MCFDSNLKKQLPNHVAFIMDGNRRWAKKKKLEIIDGHKKGSEIVKKIVKKSLEFNIKYLTFFSFSTENWSRSKDEILNLQTLLSFYENLFEEIFDPYIHKYNLRYLYFFFPQNLQYNMFRLIFLL